MYSPDVRITTKSLDRNLWLNPVFLAFREKAKSTTKDLGRIA